MRRRLLQCVSLLLAMVLVCTVFQPAAIRFPARAAEDELTQEGDGDQHISLSSSPYHIQYNDNMFFKNANAESTDLAKLGVELAWAAYSDSSVRELYGKMGFSCRSYNYDRELTYEDNDYVFYSFGYKKVDNTNIVLVTVKGTGDNAEWFSDFNLGSGDVHYGFLSAATKMQEDLDEYLAQYLSPYGSERNVIFFTGHSRGAAVSNLLGKYYTKSYPQYFKSGDVFCYTFACPNVERNPDKTLYNIHNYNNPGDCVPEMPLASWGFGRNGQDHFLTSSGDVFNNFLYQFNQKEKTEYLGTTGTRDFTAPMEKLARDREEYLDNQVIFKLLASVLAGKSEGLPKILEYFLCVLADEAGRALDDLENDIYTTVFSNGFGYLVSGVIVAEEIKSKFNDCCMEEYDRLESLIIAANAAIQEYYFNLAVHYGGDASEYPFSRYAAESQTVQEIAAAARIVIQEIDDLRDAINIFKGLQEKIQSFVEKLMKLLDILLCAIRESEVPLWSFFTRVGHAHMPETYACWMRSMYFGYEGWTGYTADIPLLSIPEKITRVGYRCFYGCKGIVEMVVPDSVVKFDYPLEYCTGLKRLTLPVEQLHSGRDTTYGSSYHGYDLNMRDLPILYLHLTPGKTGYMRDTYLHEGIPFPSLATLEIDNGITNIGDRVFQKCTGLKNITLPDTLRQIGDNAFEGCVSLETVSIPAGTEKLGGGAFHDCTNLKTVTLPDSIREIGYSCFSGCASLALSPVLPASLETVGGRAFYGCASVKEFVFPAGTKELGEYAFYGSGLKNLTLPCHLLPQLGKSYINYDNMLDTLTVIPGTNGEAQCTQPNVNVRRLVLSEGITSVADEALAYYSIESVVLPPTLQSIGSRAFYKCENLTSVSLPQGIQSIGESAFAESGLKQIAVPGGIASLGNGAFSGCRSLTAATVGSGITVLPEYLFSYSALTEVSLPAGLTEIKDYAFAGTSLQSIALPDSLQTIGNFVFESCDALETVSLPAGLREIGDLSHWTGLRRLSFPEGIKNIPRIYECKNLEELAIPESAESNTNGSFDSGRMFENCSKLTDIYYAGTETTFPIAVNYYFMPHFTVHYRCNMHQHTPGEPVRENEALPTCYKSGRYDEVTYCTVCGKSLSHTLVSVDRVAHTPDEPVKENAVVAGCAVAGSYEEATYCTVCQKELSRKVIETEKLAHTPGEAVRERELPATCYRGGLYDTVVYCAVCRQELSRKTETAAKTAHAAGAAVRENERAATCVKAGAYDTAVYCTVCKQELSRKTETVAKTAHTPAAAVRENERAATCANTGAYDTVVYCTVCMQELSRKTETVAKTAHTPGAPVKENETAPTCAKAGGYNEVTYCTVCHAKLKEEKTVLPVDANNHSAYATWLVNSIEATAAEPGYTGDLVCLGCGAVLEKGREIPATGGNTPEPGEPEQLIDTPIAKETAVHTLIVANKTKAQSLLDAIPGAILFKADGQPADPDAKVGSGMTLKKPDGTEIPVIVPGDANGDGSVTAADARLALRAAVKLETFEPWQTAAALVGTNTKVTAAEARHILRGAVGLEDPAQWFAAAVKK